jgi:hypothetical protein
MMMNRKIIISMRVMMIFIMMKIMSRMIRTKKLKTKTNKRSQW